MWIRSALAAAGIVWVAAGFNTATAQIKSPPPKVGPVPGVTLPPPIVQPPPPGTLTPSFKPPPSFSPPGTGSGGPPPTTGVPGGCPPNCPVPYQPDDVELAMRNATTVITLNEQIRQFEEISKLEQRHRVEAALKVLAAHWLVPVPRVADAVQRDAVIKQTRNELEGLLQKALTATVALMVDDVRRLQPFSWNPFAGARRREVESWERQVRDAGQRAERELASPATFREVRASQPPRGAVEFRPGKAMQQLRQIHQTGRWRNQ